MNEWEMVSNLLSLYNKAYGQSLNKQKSSIFFRSNTKPTVRNQIFEKSGARWSGNSKIYLGLPSLVGKSRYRAFKKTKRENVEKSE